jgi:hypothetical protein
MSNSPQRPPLAVSRLRWNSVLWSLTWNSVLWSLTLAATAASAQGLFRLDFEGPEPSWRSGGGDAPHALAAHQRLQGAAHSGQACEHVRLSAGSGSHVYLEQKVDAARVIDELRPTVWIKSDRPGLQLMVRVVLPRTLGPSGQPASVLLRGTSYTKVNTWEQLRIDNLPKLLAREAVWLRSRGRLNVDPREAYLDAVLLNIYGGPGVTHVWIDDLELAGFVEGFTGANESIALTRWSPPQMAPSAPPKAKVEMNGSLLIVEGHPFFTRAIEYQGEPLKFLHELGFNTLKLNRFPTLPLLAEAEGAGMWLICPPPERPIPLSLADAPGWSRILCWDLGEQLCGRELPHVLALADELKSLDSPLVRPLTADAETDLSTYSRHIDLLRASRAPLASSLELADYHTWLRERPRLARAGTTLWTTIQTEPAVALEEQLRLVGSATARPQLTSEQIRLTAYCAVAAGVRGLIFASRSRLDAQDPLTRQRALTLELLNLELEILQPFCAAGTLVSLVQGSQPEVRAALLQADRARMLLPFWCGRYAQYVPGQSAANEVAFILPGVPETCNAYELTPGGLQLLKRSRGAGGLRVALDEFGLLSAVLLTYDPLSLTSLSRKQQASQRRAAELQRQLTGRRIEQVEAVDRRLPPLPASADAVGWIRTARSHLQQAETHFTAGPQHLADSFQHAARALRSLRMVELAHWEQAQRAIGSPVAVPAATHYSTLPDFWSLLSSVRNSQVGLNLLPAGDCESLQRLMQSGWRHFEHPQDNLQTEVQLLPAKPHAGQCSLQLRVWPADSQAAVPVVETPPVWITTAGVPIEAGQLLRIRGWIDVPAPIAGSVDGLMIFDSLAGPALAERIGQTRGWQEFSLYRVAPQSDVVSITFALTGIGTARIDDVAIEPIIPRGAQQARLP